MKYLIPAIFLILGLSVGYFVGKNSNQVQEKNIAVKTVTSPSKIKVVHDTIVKQTVVELEKPSIKPKISLDSTTTDSILNKTLDTTKINYITKNDTLEANNNIANVEENIKINSDKKIDIKQLKIIQLSPQHTSKSDSLINKMINVKPIYIKEIIVEFWESPLNYSGYKMSKSKLIVYGLNPHFNYELYYKNGKYFLNFEQVYYQLEETLTFKPYLSIKKEELFND
jgi:hypothetical protein